MAAPARALTLRAAPPSPRLAARARCSRPRRNVAPLPARAAAERRPSCGASAAVPPAAWRGDPPAPSSLPTLPSGKLDYSSIDALPQSKVLTAVVRKLLVEEVGKDTDPRPWTDFEALMTPVREVNDAPGSAADVQARARRVFQGILPSIGLGFVPAAWRRFIKPAFPTWVLHFSFFSVFYLLFPWLMGPLAGAEHVEVDAPASLVPLLRALKLPLRWRVPQAVKAERCRFLEAAQCASVCVNSCKAPTQAWMKDDFGLDLHIQPNYADLSCTWSFGKVPPPLAQDDALLVPCFTACPSTMRGVKDAARQRVRVARGVGVVDGVDTFTGETLEAIAARASAAALAEAGAAPDAAALADVAGRKAAVAEGGKCWSVDESRGSAI